MKLLIRNNHLDKNLHIKDTNLEWIISLYKYRNDGGIVDCWEGKYPTFVMTRREQIKFFIRLYKKSVKH